MTIEIKTVPGHKLGDAALAAEVAEKLGNTYPGWGWDVFIDDEPTGGHLVVISQIFEGFNPLPTPWGLRMHLSTAYTDPSRLKILKRAGQMLEFCGLPQRYTGGDLDLTEFARNYQTYYSGMNYGYGPKD
jgi:hypothetical protein